MNDYNPIRDLLYFILLLLLLAGMIAVVGVKAQIVSNGGDTKMLELELKITDL